MKDAKQPCGNVAPNDRATGHDAARRLPEARDAAEHRLAFVIVGLVFLGFRRVAGGYVVDTLVASPYRDAGDSIWASGKTRALA